MVALAPVVGGRTKHIDAVRSSVVASAQILTGTHHGPHGTRAWRLVVPDGSTTAPRPLLVMLHGCLQNAADIARGSNLDAVAEREGILVLYPEQPTTANPRQCWNWFDPAHQHRDRGEPALLAGLVADVVQQHGGDASRVHIAGVSAGAAMATLVAVAYPEQFVSITSVAGVGWQAATTVAQALSVMQRGAGDALPSASVMLAAMGAHARTMPVFIVHGEADNVVHVNNASETASQFVAVHQALRTKAGLPALQAETLPPRDEHGLPVHESQWRDEHGRAVVTVLRVGQLGHAFPFGNATGSFTDARGPDVAGRLGALVASYRR